MPKPSAKSDKLHIHFLVSANDQRVIDWLRGQENRTASLLALIRRQYDRCGPVDVVFGDDGRRGNRILRQPPQAAPAMPQAEPEPIPEPMREPSPVRQMPPLQAPPAPAQQPAVAPGHEQRKAPAEGSVASDLEMIQDLMRR